MHACVHGTRQLRLSKISAGLTQDLIGLSEFAHLAFQGLHPLGHLGRHSGPLASVDLGLFDPFQQRLRHAADLPRDRLDGRPSRGMFVFIVEHQPDGTLADFG